MSQESILIVDDDPASLKVLSEYLKEASLEVLVVTHAEAKMFYGKEGKMVGTLQDVTEHKQMEERLTRIHECFLNFGVAPLENINHLTALCGEILGATCALYNRLDEGLLCSWGQWNTPPDYNPVDNPEGHICYDVIQQGKNEAFVIRNLLENPYAQTDPNVILYKLKTYMGWPVKFGDTYVGSLCVVYQNDFAPSEANKRFLGIIASAIGMEEKRKQAEEELLAYRDHLEELVEKRTAELKAANERLQQEITERKRAEEALKQKITELNSFINNIPDMAWLKDIDSRFIAVSKAFCETVGMSSESLINQSCEVCFGKEVARKFREDDQKVMSEGRQVIIEEKIIDSQNNEVWLETIKSPILNESEQAVGTVGIARNITERKRSEEAIKKTHDELKARVNELSALNRITQTVTTGIDLEAALDIVAETMTGLFNAQGTLISLLNETQTEATAVAHYVRKNVKQGSLVGFVLPVSKIPAPFITQVIDNGQSMVVSQAQINPLTKPIHDILRSREVHGLMNIPLQIRGKVIGIIMVGTNQVNRVFTFAEVKLAETIAGQIAGAIENARLFDEEHHQRQVAESLREVALVLNSSLDQKTVLAQILAQLGRVIQYDSAGVFLRDGNDLILSDGVNLAETFIGNRIPVSHGNPTARVFRNKQPLVLADVHTDPDWKIWKQADPIQSWIGAPLLIGEKAIGVLTVDNFKIGAYREEETQILQTFANQAAIAIQNAQLFNEAQRAREEALEAQRAAENANKAKSEFLANMSHEIRTPMNVVLGFTELLDRLITDPKQKSYLNSIKSGGKSLLTLINDILDLSKIEAGKMEIRPESVNLTVIFQEITQIFHTTIVEKKLEYLAEVASDIPKSLLLDEVRLRQVLFNLIGNAIKFTDRGYVELTATTISPYNEESYLELLITVEDSGIGIPESQQEIIFEAFRQQDGQTTRKYGGTGLGLAITKRLVKIMGGTITLTSEVGKGSRFEIVFQHVPVAATSAISLREEQIEDQQFTFEPATVLIVEDIQQNRLLIKEYFHDTDFNVLEAENGEQAILLAQQYQPDIIFMDIRMPVMNGYEATKQLKATKELQGIPVIALTASVMKKEQDKIKESGFDGYLQKPVNRAAVFRELSRVLPHPIPKVCLEPSERVDLSEEVLAEILKHFSELIEKLENECMTLWEAACQSGSFEEIEAFGTRIQTLGEQYSLNILQEFGENLLAQVRSFDVEQIDVILDAYPKLIEDIKSFNCS